VASIQEFPRPSFIKELQAYLGMVNFFRRSLPIIAHTLLPLTDGLCDGKKGSDWLEPFAMMDAAFAAANQAHSSSGIRGGLPAAAASRQKGLAAPGFLLLEARDRPAEVLCF
jgi:hypothetical protein